MGLLSVDVQARDPAQLEALIGPARAQEFEATAEAARSFLAGRRVLNVNSTGVGGGVAELLQTLLAYARGVGVDVDWVVIEGSPEFFAITKRIHNLVYGGPGDGGPLDAAERSVYEEVLEGNAAELRALVRPGDILLLHDPQTAGLVEAARAAGALCVWRCHIGRDLPNEHTERGWSFLRPYVESADAFVFTRKEFAPEWLDAERLVVIPPSIDPFSAKNQSLAPPTVASVLRWAGLAAGEPEPEPVLFARRDGSPGRLDRHADILQTGPPPPPGGPVVLQASRWDHMKDMAGVMEGFAAHVDPATGAHLVLAGPAVHGVADDPEAAEVLDDCIERWRALPHEARTRVHLACVPMHDPDEAAVIVNALQHHATVVLQKSLAEGFGLTVTEAMWKSRAVVATKIGGIADQIVDGEHGLLLEDPLDLEAMGAAINRLLGDPALTQHLGERARERVHEEYLGDRHLERYAALFSRLRTA